MTTDEREWLCELVETMQKQVNIIAGIVARHCPEAAEDMVAAQSWLVMARTEIEQATTEGASDES